MINKISKQTIENNKLIVELKANVCYLQNTLDDWIATLKLGFWIAVATMALVAFVLISIDIWS